MDSKEKKSFSIVDNHFQNACSDFAYHTTLNTTAHLTKPFYAKLSVTRNANGLKMLGIKTSQSIMHVFYKNTDFQEHKKLVVDDDRLDRHVIASFIFKSEIYSVSNPPCVLIGYRSGLVAYIDCMKEKLLGLYNVDEKNRTINKNQVVSQLVMLPKPNGDEVLVVFEDSTAIRYKLNTQSQNVLFVEKLKKFELKTNFNRALNKFKHRTKTKNNLVFSSYLNEPEFSHFFAYNQEQVAPNPVAYYKFNHRTISDLVVKRHRSFTKTLLKDSYEQEITVLGFTSLDGYLVLFEINRMKPLLSYKGSFGGINSMTFSENGELIALSGQDDCITVLDLNTLTALKCEGHKSFVSKALFQTISFHDEASKSTKSSTKNGEEGKTNDYIRIIGGGMDAMISFWEFPRNIFGTKRKFLVEENQTIRLHANNKIQMNTIKPLYMESVKDAVGWIEICDDMLIQCGYDGVISTYVIRDYIPDREGEDEGPNQELTLSTIKPKSSAENFGGEDFRSRSRKGTEEGERQRSDQPQFRKQESESGYRREQEEYKDERETVSHSMEHLEGQGNKTPYKSPSRGLGSSKLSEQGSGSKSNQ